MSPPILNAGDEFRFEAGRRVYYALVLQAGVRLQIRIRQGGPHGPLEGDFTFDRHPTFGELRALVS